MKSTLLITTALVTLLILSGCGDVKNTENTANKVQTTVTPPAVEGEMQQTESDRLNAYFEKTFMREVMDSPEFQTYLGIKKDYGKWDVRTEEKAAADYARVINDLKDLTADFEYNKLDAATQLSYRLAERMLKEQIEGYQWRYHGYPVNQMFGWQSDIPAFMINFHRVTSLEDAEAYISRLEGVKETADQRMAGMTRNQEKGILPPKFVFAHVKGDAKNIITGAPFNDGDDSTLLADFKKKVMELELDDADLVADLIKRAEAALLTSVKPAYEDLIALLGRQEAVAGTDDGVWRLPEGEAFYKYRLREITSTEMTASEIHQLGLDEVARIHGEMRDIMKQVNFKGSLQDFFEFTRKDEQFYYPETDAGKKAYLDKATQLIDTMKGRLDDVFVSKPKADLIVKAVEAFREKSAGKAFYSRPAMDGSRPGIYYANLYKMSEMPTYQMEALAYHEGIPGHHMQIAIMQELEDIPKFRKFSGYTAYVEGWGLYSEYLPKEMGFYSDPYSDFGRLAMEIWRACRLVVDTGLHDKKWTREQAITYLATNTPNPKGDVIKAIERYIVMPGQATAYKIGMIKIQQLRKRAELALGDKFDLRDYHEVILRDGALPLSTLEDNVNEWIAAQQ
ncbi:MAG: DUF885 domain-containing protein [Emcibacter sp.]|nr:DUF885 domain-containing protein [Emcibacter sp.]